MSINQFADVSRDLCSQIKVIENLVKSKSFNEAKALMTNAAKSCRTLESLAVEDNKIQTRIVANRQKEISWINDAIQSNLGKSRNKTAVKRNSNTE